MKYEILRCTPISGDYEEKHFGKTDPYPLWIKFNPVDSESWVGSFASGEIKLINLKILEIDKSSKIGIITNGDFYLIDIDSMDLKFQYDDGDCIDFEFLDQNLFFLATFNRIYIFKNYELIKKIQPDAIDGIRFTSKTDNQLIGEIYDAGVDWVEFQLDTRTLKMKWMQFEY